jgi:hypothetical protein
MSLSSIALKARQEHCLERRRVKNAGEKNDIDLIIKRAVNFFRSNFGLKCVPRPLFNYDGSITIDGIRLYPRYKQAYGDSFWFVIWGNCPVCDEVVESQQIRNLQELGAVLKEFRPNFGHAKQHARKPVQHEEPEPEPSCPWNQGYPCVESHCRMWVRGRQECAFPLIAIGLSGEVIHAVKGADHA